MPEALTESFCERCGTRYEFKTPTRLNPLRKTRGLVSGLRNYIMSQDALGDAVGDAMRSEEEALAARQLEAFHDSFNFCIDCRQYTCVNCWNHEAGRCRACVPIPGTDDLLERFEASFQAQHPERIAISDTELTANGASATLDPTAWPASDLGTARNGHSDLAWPEAELIGAPALDHEAQSAPEEALAGPMPTEPEVVAEVEPEPEFVDAFSQPMPAVPQFQPEPEYVAEVSEPELNPVAEVEVEPELDPVAEVEVEPELEPTFEPVAEVEAEPELVAGIAPTTEFVAEPEPDWGVAEPEPQSVVAEPDAVEPTVQPIAAWEEDAPYELLAEEPLPEPDLVAELTPESQPELAAEFAPEPEPEVVAEFEPEPAAPEFAPEPEPEVVAEAEPEPAAFELAAEFAPEPQPEVVEPAAEGESAPAQLPEPRPIRPITDTILRLPRPEYSDAAPPRDDRVAAQTDDPALAARRAQLDLLGLGDPGEGPVAPAARTVLPYRSSGASAGPVAAMRPGSVGAASGSFWDASAREVASALSQVGVQSCGQCGLSLSASARFCRRCGTRQARSA
jgi:ribosomal protein L40E